MSPVVWYKTCLMFRSQEMSPSCPPTPSPHTPHHIPSPHTPHHISFWPKSSAPLFLHLLGKLQCTANDVCVLACVCVCVCLSLSAGVQLVVVGHLVLRWQWQRRAVCQLHSHYPADSSFKCKVRGHHGLSHFNYTLPGFCL